MPRSWLIIAILIVPLAAGCGARGPELPVNGVVTMDGRPLDGATVTFIPEAETSSPTVGTAETGSDGKFVITGTQGESGLAPGKYKVTVSKLKLPPKDGGSPEDPASVGAVTDADVQNDLPSIYSNPSQTILSYSVTGDGKPIEIKLSSKRK